MSSAPSANSLPSLRFSDLIFLGINAIVGSGIYIFPGTLAAALGPASVLAFGLGGLCCAVIGLCFAEAASRFSSSGGPYQYARAAFGDLAGFLVGWSCWCAAVLSFASVASAVPPYLSFLSPRLAEGWIARGIAAALVLGFCLINYRGLRPAAYATNLLTVAKLLPLGLLIVLALFALPSSCPTFAPFGLAGLPRATFLVFFAYQGFEVVPVPAGESSAPRRHAPLAVLLSLGASAALYMTLQGLATISTPTIATSVDKPLTEMGMTLLGIGGAMLVNFGAIVSMLGFCAGVALCGPRYLSVLAEDQHLPRFFAHRHSRHGSPDAAITATALLTSLLVLTLDFRQLIDLSVITVGLQYLATCLAVPLLRRKKIAAQESWTLPGGFVLPLLGALISVWMIQRARGAELLCFAALLVSGLFFFLLPKLRK